MREEPGYLRVADGWLYRVLHRPAEATGGAASSPGPAVLIVPPLFDEARCAHATLVALARALAAAGAPALRFDFRGTGDSSGEHAEITLARLMEDLAAALAELRRLGAPAASLAAAGLRLGATLLAREAPTLGLARLLLLAPLAAPRQFFREAALQSRVRRGLTGAAEATGTAADNGERLDLEGLATSHRLVEELSALDLADGRMRLPEATRTLLLQLGPRAGLSAETERLAAVLGPAVRAEGLVLPPVWRPIDLVELSPFLARAVDFLTATESGDGR